MNTIIEKHESHYLCGYYLLIITVKMEDMFCLFALVCFVRKSLLAISIEFES